MSKELNTFHDDGDLLNRLKIAFEITSAKDVMEVTDINLKSMYQEINRKLFQNVLPEIPLKWTRSMEVGGKVEFKSKRVGRDYTILRDTVTMSMSKMFKKSIDDFKATFIHEMIHVWEVFGTDRTDEEILKDDADNRHGRAWKRKRDELERITGLKIPMTDNFDPSSLTDSITFDSYMLLLEVEGEGYWITKLSKPFILKNKVQILHFMERVVKGEKLFKDPVKFKRAIFLHSQQKELAREKKRQSIKSFKTVSKKEGDFIIDTAKEVFEEFTKDSKRTPVELSESDKKTVGVIVEIFAGSTVSKLSVWEESVLSRNIEPLQTKLELMKKISHRDIEFLVIKTNDPIFSGYPTKKRVRKDRYGDFNVDWYRPVEELNGKKVVELLDQPTTKIVFDVT